MHFISSHGVTYPEIPQLLRDLKLEDVPSVSLINCPVPVDPYASLFSSIGLNVSKIENLKMQFVGNSSQNLEGMLAEIYRDQLISNAYRISFSKLDESKGARSHENGYQEDRQNIL